ncbi:MAG: molybdopterin-dependent oxidoreductase, partial [Dehalococcoidia bacterium]|nr:molybdopterin-dependent oxidoreductase [Dehalococcoidia bacterium]
MHTQDGRLLKVTEDPQGPQPKLFSPQVKSCLRARAAAEWFYHPDRLHFPLKRAGAKGEGKWERISWEQALDEIAGKLKELKAKYGPETLATTVGTGRSHYEFRSRFMHLFGSPNQIGQGHICWGPQQVVCTALFGWATNPIVRSETKCVLAWGGGIPDYMPPAWRATLEAMKKGAKLIAVDPRRVGAAERADIWLQLRPGTDTALAMGMINVIISEGLYDKEFVSRWCYGFDKLKERAAQYPLEKVAGITWVPAEKIREAARMYATLKPAASFNGMGIEHLSNSIQALHARFILPAITGNLDVKGGDLLSGPHPGQVSAGEMELYERLSPEQWKKQLGSDRFRLMAWPGFNLIEPNVKRVWGKICGTINTSSFGHAPTVYRAMVTGKPYPVRALITTASNPMVTQGNTRLVYQALKSLDLYAVMDFWLTPSAQLADYVLPAASWLERPTIWDAWSVGRFVHACEAAVPATMDGEYDHRTDFDLYRELGVRLGQAQEWPWKSLEEAYSYRLAALAPTFKDFITEKGGYDAAPGGYRRYEQTGFGTPTGKVELSSTIFEKLGYDSLPQYEEPCESPVSTPGLTADYPLVLTTGGRHNPFYHSEHRQIPSLRKRHPYPLVQLHPDTAGPLDIAEGDWVWIETPRGRIKQRAKLFKGIDPRVVHAQHGWWFPEMPGE